MQSAATLPVHLFPVLTDGRSHDEPFYAVMGFAPTDHGLGSICRVSQKQVVNVAQHGGLAPLSWAIGPRTCAARQDPRARGAGARGARGATIREAPRPRRGDSLARVGRGDVSARRCRRRPRGAARRRRRPAARVARERSARRLGRGGRARARHAVRGSPRELRAPRDPAARAHRTAGAPRRGVRRGALALPRGVGAAHAKKNDFDAFAKPFALLLDAHPRARRRVAGER